MIEALIAEAAAHRDRGDNDAARRCCAEVLRLSPGHSGGLNLMAAIAADEGHVADTVAWAQLALEADQNSAEPYYSMARAYQADGRAAQAEAAYRESLARDPAQARAHNNLGCVLQMQGQLDSAIACFRRALDLEPQLAQAQQNLAGLTRDPAALEQAAVGYRRQAKARPSDPEPCVQLGNVYRELGLHREALASFDEAIRRNPAHASARFSRSHELLMLGEWREGLQEHEWRWKVKGLGMPPRDCAQPEWDGRELARGTVLLHAEQGLGDTVQFIRYVPLVAARCAAVLVECAPQLAGLLRSVPGGARILGRGEALPAFDAHLPLMSLPRIFDTTPHTVPWNGPYLSADPRRIEAWRQELAPAAKRHVGLAWAGNPQYWDDRKRSMALAALAPLAGVEGVAFYSLQWGTGSAQLGAPPARLRVADFGDRIRDLAETAALMRCMDLVLSVDTCAAHIAGALGVPTWLMLAYSPDWRWLLGRGDTPWYPSVCLFRQRAGERGWDPVVCRVADALQTLA